MIERIECGNVAGFLHRSVKGGSAGIVLAHGAGSNANSRLLIELADEFSSIGWCALRIDLPFRQARPHGPPHPSFASKDRAGIAEAITWLRDAGCGAVFAGGHSYGGRQASMLAAEQPGLVQAVLLLSYPLHPPRKPEQLRIAHFARFQTPALFVHGSRDPFGSPDEIRTHLPPESRLLLVDGAAHELKPVVTNPAMVVEAFLDYVGSTGR